MNTDLFPFETADEAVEAGERPSPTWFAQAAASFAATAGAIGFVFAIALTGGWATFEFGAPPQPPREIVADLRDGQFYQEQWIDPETGAPFAAQVDEVSVDYAMADYDAGLYEDIAWEPEPLAGGPAPYTPAPGDVIVGPAFKAAAAPDILTLPDLKA